MMHAGAGKARQEAEPNYLVFNILTSKPFVMNILQGMFV
jgi:hypothetical protein